MNLRSQAEMDLANIVEDTDRGFALDIIVTNPKGKTAACWSFC